MWMTMITMLLQNALVIEETFTPTMCSTYCVESCGVLLSQIVLLVKTFIHTLETS